MALERRCLSAPRACLTLCCVRDEGSFAADADGAGVLALAVGAALTGRELSCTTVAVAAAPLSGTSVCLARSIFTISQVRRHAVARPPSTHPIAIARCFHQARRVARTPDSKTSIRLCSPDEA